MRRLRAVPRGLSDAGLHRSRFSRRLALPRVLDDRAPWSAARSRQGGARRSRLRLRRVPGGMPLERGRRAARPGASERCAAEPAGMAEPGLADAAAWALARLGGG
jgi:hypothetical protein